MTDIRKVVKAYPMGVTIAQVEKMTCPRCDARPGKACTSIKAHQSRLDAYIRRDR